ncbi:MAG TPA: XdhC family protein [Dehalococcoidales bacterium]|nr:XdhC family protein [Dehalococcoidales bacterium]
MIEEFDLIRMINGQLEKGSSCVLASIILLDGSSPRHTGTKMVLADDGRSFGTIGGSLLEATSLAESRRVLADRQPKLLDFFMNGRDAASKGMICGGKTTILLDYIDPSPENRKIFLAWQKAVWNNQNINYITHFRRTNIGIDIIARSIQLQDGPMVTAGTFEDHLKDFSWEAYLKVDQITIIEEHGITLIVDPIRKMKTVYCLGAGHVAVPTAHIAALCGFRVIVLDDRAEFASTERFPNAHEVRVIDSFQNALEGLRIDADSFIVIFTRGHQFDREVLEQSLKTGAGYIGMISSRRKRDMIYDNLREKGVNQSDLDRVSSPIGLPIGGETPADIAVSIVAELIKMRSQPK